MTVRARAPLSAIRNSLITALRIGVIDGLFSGHEFATDGRTLDVAVVVWTTGFRPDTSWIDLPVFDPVGEPMRRRGVVETRPGIYGVGGCSRTPWRRP